MTPHQPVGHPFDSIFLQVWLQGAEQNPIVEWKGCHKVGANDELFDEHESSIIKGDGKWRKIVVYLAQGDVQEDDDVPTPHMFLRVKKGASYLSVAQMNIRHNTGE